LAALAVLAGASAVVAAVLRALAVPVPALPLLARRQGSEAQVLAELLVLALLVVLPEQLPRVVVARSAAAVELPSRQSSSAAMARRSASGATGPR
jgi:hypothetical protein